MTTAQSPSTHAQAPSYDLTGKRVVVVGGKTGIGLGIAQAAHASGASVTVASRRSAPVADHPELAPFEQVEFDMGEEEAVRVHTPDKPRTVLPPSASIVIRPDNRTQIPRSGTAREPRSNVG